MLAEHGLMSHLEPTTSDRRAWGLEFGAGDDVLVGPLTAFRRRSPTTVVTVIAPDDVPRGRPVGQREITEWKGASDIGYFDFDGYQGLFHHGGGNWVLWNPDLSRLFVTAAPSWPTTWVHVRFVLRHLIVAGLLTRPGYHCIHSVVAESPGGAVMVVGPTGSGKTRLVNRLVEQGAVAGVVEDDCSVVDSDWVLTSLIPTEHELRRPRSLPVRAVVLMDTDAAGPEAVTGEVAAAFAAATPTPWPAAWLPGATPRAARIGRPPTGCAALRVPARSDNDDEVLDAVSRLVASD